MQAIVLTRYGGPEVLTLSDVADPEPGPEEIRIRVGAAGVNRADLMQRAGRYPPPEPRPRVEIPGLECAGVVDAVGERVTRFRPGDRAAALVTGGGYAERVAVHERMAFPVPDALSDAEAAAVPEAFLTAYDALTDKAGLGAGRWVLIHAAAGGVGSAAVALAKWMGAHVVATAGSAAKVEFVRRLGADVAVNYRSERFLEAVRSETPGVDAVIDFVGRAYWDDNIAALREGGVLVVVGTLSGAEATVNLGALLARRLTVRGTALRSRPPEARMRLMQEFVRYVLPCFRRDGGLWPMVDRTFPLAEARAAHEWMEQNANRGKIILTVERP